MKEIPVKYTTLFATVDDEDFERLSQYEWRLVDTSIVRNVSKAYSQEEKKLYNSRHRTIHISLASEVMNRHGVLFDHANRNPLDNQKHNIRECTVSQNNANRRKMKNSTSKYKGVSWSKARSKWKVGTTVRGVKIHVGYFENEIEAAKAYDKLAVESFKEFANLNFKDKI